MKQFNPKFESDYKNEDYMNFEKKAYFNQFTTFFELIHANRINWLNSFKVVLSQTFILCMKSHSDFVSEGINEETKNMINYRI